MTEDEAKTKWCPHVRDTDEGVGSFNRIYNWIYHKVTGARETRQGLEESCCCIGSECMAWRKNPAKWEHVAEDEPVDIKKTSEGRYIVTAYFDDGKKRINPDQGGYCGLAGKP